ncbi:MAG: nucleotidyltransferase domain-containing protein, partial [Dehalococcoidia bacterium]
MRSLRAAAAAAAVALLLLAIVATPASSQEVAITPAAVSVDTPLPRGGEAALPAVVVRNRGSSAIPIRMSAIGENAAVAAWARFGPDAFDLDPGESRLVEVYLDIPRDAALETHRLLLRAAIPTDTGSGGVRLSVSLAVASAIEFEVGEAVATGAGPWMRYGLPLLLGIAGGALTVVGVPGLWRSLRRLASLRLRAPSLPGLRRNAAPPLKRHPDVERAVEALLAEVRAILGARFVAMYLEGSLAGGGFAPPRSDIDVVVVTEGDLPLEVVAALAAMHARLSFDVPWGDELEVSYLPREVVRRHDPTHVEHPRIGRYEGLTVQEHGREWDIHRRILRERGITVAGPPPADL